MKEYEMTDLRCVLGIKVKQSSEEIFISQEKYVANLLKRINMISCKPVATPMAINEKMQQNDGAEKVDSKIFHSLVGCLVYLTNTRLDILFSMSIISRFIKKQVNFTLN
jgi:hypothetical protein